MTTTSGSGTKGKSYLDTELPSFLPTVVRRIRQKRDELGEGQWLCEELRIALNEMAPILERARVAFEEVGAAKRSIVIRAMGLGGRGPTSNIEGYSIKMMSNCLRNAGSTFLSRALDPECRDARQRLIDDLAELYRLLTDPQASKHRAREGRGEARDSSLLVALRERHREEGRARLLAAVVEMSTVAKFRETNEDAFQRIFDSIWEQVDAGSLTEAVAAGKILDRVYAERAGKRPPVKAVEVAPAEVIAPVAATAVEPVPEREPPPIPEPAKLPPILDHWVGQGLTAHRIFRDLQKTSDIKTLVTGLAKISSARRIDAEYLFILHVLNSVARFEADGETVAFAVPQIPKMGFTDFERLVEKGKTDGAGDIDPRLWGVIGSVYSFLKNWLGPQLQQR